MFSPQPTTEVSQAVPSELSDELASLRKEVNRLKGAAAASASAAAVSAAAASGAVSTEAPSSKDEPPTKGAAEAGGSEAAKGAGEDKDTSTGLRQRRPALGAEEN
jgi:hypothetical protein